MIRDSWRRTLHELKINSTALYLASKDGHLPVAAKIGAALLLAYALSPIDLIPDFIPVLGYLDDLILLPLGMMLVIRMIPEDVWQQYRALAAGQNQPLPRNYVAAAIIVCLWLAALAAIIWYMVAKAGASQ